MPLVAGDRLGHYQLLAPLGAGGMGQVYLARDERLGRKVAIKVLPPELLADEQARKRLRREAQAIAALDHPNICTVYEVGEENGQAFIVMQYIEGETLAQRAGRQTLSLAEALDLAEQIADALAEAHARSVIHRDIKPQNIMINARGQAKVLDFGLAKVVREPEAEEGTAETEEWLTARGMVLGTLRYMSPEQVRGEELDARSDIFSFGTLLYEMCSGQYPFASPSKADTMAAILLTEPPVLSKFRPDLPARLQEIIGRAQTKSRAKRYQTARELYNDLKALKLQLTSGMIPVHSGSMAAPVETSSGAHEEDQTRILSAASASSDASAARSMDGSGVRPAIQSLAILPFANVSADPDTEYLSDGVTESLINSLSQIPSLRVIARSSAFRYKGQEIDLQKVGGELGVQAILKGRVMQRGLYLTLSVELEEVSSNSQLWGEQYNRRFSDIFEMQESISREISRKLRLRLTSEMKQALVQRHTENVESYQLYLKGRFYADTWTPEGVQQALTLFQQAIKLDPNYALAYAAMANAYWALSSQFAAPKEVMPKVKEAALQALVIDETLPEAHTALAVAKAVYDHDYPGAESEFRRAVELNPGSASAHEWYGYVLTPLGRQHEAVTQIELALELDPFSVTANSSLGLSYFWTKQYDAAIEQFRKTFDMAPELWWAHFFMGWAYDRKGMPQEALAALDEAIRLGSTYAAAYRSYIRARAGETAEAERLLVELQAQQTYVSPHHIAIVYAGLGDRERTFEWLEKAYESREEVMIFLNVDPTWDDLRDDPRFQSLLQRVGLK
ncbi:MAG: protein kinase domain-containing protein [Pyrinomonadaceae bacterium]